MIILNISCVILDEFVCKFDMLDNIFHPFLKLVCIEVNAVDFIFSGLYNTHLQQEYMLLIYSCPYNTHLK